MERCLVDFPSMPIRLGHFYASLLLLICLGINIAFFSEVREPFLGDEDPLASVKAALSDLNIKAKFAEIYPKIASETDGESTDTTSLEPSTKTVKPVETPKQPVGMPKKTEPDKSLIFQPSPTKTDPVVDPFLLSTPPPKASTPVAAPKDYERKQIEKTKPTEPKKESGVNRQTAAVMPMPQPATTRPIVADHFKPIESAKPSTEAVWDTIDTVLERPLRYD